MATVFPGLTGRDAETGPGSGYPGPQRSGDADIDWRAARRAARGCCCPARPVVIAVMPPAPGRPHPTDLLLCGHHYRVSRQALAAAGASVLNLDGTRAEDRAWAPARCGG